MTDKPYRGRKGGRYVRSSRDEAPRRAGEAASDIAQPDTTKTDPAELETNGAADDGLSETTPPATGRTAGKPARKRN